VLAALSDQGILADELARPQMFFGATSRPPITWTCQFLRAVSIVVAAVSAAGLLLFLSARGSRPPTLLMRRMALSRRAWLRSALLELGVLTGWAWPAGTLAGARSAARLSNGGPAVHLTEDAHSPAHRFFCVTDFQIAIPQHPIPVPSHSRCGQ
jgi:hypothetical protein